MGQIRFTADDETKGIKFEPDAVDLSDPNTFVGPEDNRGFFRRTSDAAKTLAKDHPYAREIVQRALTGTSPEHEAMAKSQGIEQIQGPGLMAMPGLETIKNYLQGDTDRSITAAQDGITSSNPDSNWWKGFLGGVNQEILGLAEGGFDPRTAGVKTPNLKVGRPQIEKRLKEITDSVPAPLPKPIKGLLPARSTATGVVANERMAAPNVPTELENFGSTVDPKVALNVNNPDIPPPYFMKEFTPPSRDVVPGRLNPSMPEVGDLGSVVTLDEGNIAARESVPYNAPEQPSATPRLKAPKSEPTVLRTADEVVTEQYVTKLSQAMGLGDKIKKVITNEKGAIGDQSGFKSVKDNADYERLAQKYGKAPEWYDSPQHELESMRAREVQDLEMETRAREPEVITPESERDMTSEELDKAMRAVTEFERARYGTVDPVEFEENLPNLRAVADRTAKSIGSGKTPSAAGRLLPGKLNKLLTDETGAITFRGKKKDEVSSIRQGLIDTLVSQRGVIPDVNRLYETHGKGLSKPQFFKVIDDIVDSGDLQSSIKSVQTQAVARDLSPASMMPEVAESPVSKLVQVVREHTAARAEQDALVTAEKSRRITNVENTPGSGVSKYFAQSRALKGAYPKVEAAKLQDALSSVDMDTLMDMVDQSPNLKTGFERYNAKTAVGRALGVVNKPGAMQPNQIELLNKVFGQELASQLVELHGGIGAMLEKNALGKTWMAAKEVNNLARTLWTSIDFSAPLRQGGGLILNKEWFPAFRDMFKYGAKEANYEQLIEGLNSRPKAELGRRAGLFISNIITDSPALKEEMWMSKIAEKIPGVRGSERAYTGFLDKVRADVFDRLVDDMEKAGFKTHDKIPYTFKGQKLERVIPTQATKELAQYINRTTGRGSLGKAGAFSDFLSTIAFSPRYQASRVQMLGGMAEALAPLKYSGMNPIVRRQYLKSLISMGGMVGISTGLSALMGHEISLDLRSSDFLKGRYGERTRQDAGQGFLQYLTLAARLATNKTTPQDGNTHTLDRTNKNGSLRYDQHAGVTGRIDTVKRFARSKESPIASFVHDWATGKDYLGRKFDIKSAVATRFINAVTQDLMALKDEDPDLFPMLDENNMPTLEGVSTPKLLPLIIPSIFGVNSNVYDQQR